MLQTTRLRIVVVTTPNSSLIEVVADAVVAVIVVRVTRRKDVPELDRGDVAGCSARMNQCQDVYCASKEHGHFDVSSKICLFKLGVDLLFEEKAGIGRAIYVRSAGRQFRFDMLLHSTLP